MRVQREYDKGLKDLPREEHLSPGSPLCAGCGGLTTLRLMHKALGGNVVVVNAAGCMTLMATYPSPLHSSWLYTTMASASAGAQGIRDALDILIEKGRRSPLCRDGLRARSGRPGRKSSSRDAAARTKIVSVAGRLSHRLGF